MKRETFGRTALDVVMVTLHAHDFEVGQPVQAHGLQLVEGDDAISVLIETLQHRLDDEFSLPLVLNFIL